MLLHGSITGGFEPRGEELWAQHTASNFNSGRRAGLSEETGRMKTLFLCSVGAEPRIEVRSSDTERLRCLESIDCLRHWEDREAIIDVLKDNRL